MYLRRSITVSLIDHARELLYVMRNPGASRAWNPESGEHPAGEGERQPYHVGVVTPDPLHESRGPPLYGVATSLPHTLPEAHVRFDLGCTEPPHPNLRYRMAHRDLFSTRDGHPGMDLVRASLQHAYEFPYFFAVPGLSEEADICGKVWQIDDGVGGEDDFVGVPDYGEGLTPRVYQNRLHGVFERYLGEAALARLEIVAGGMEEVHPPGRL